MNHLYYSFLYSSCFLLEFWNLTRISFFSFHFLFGIWWGHPISNIHIFSSGKFSCIMLPLHCFLLWGCLWDCCFLLVQSFMLSCKIPFSTLWLSVLLLFLKLIKNFVSSLSNKIFIFSVIYLFPGILSCLLFMAIRVLVICIFSLSDISDPT